MRKGEIACIKQFLLFSQCFPQLYNLSLVRQSAALCGNGLTVSNTTNFRLFQTERPYIGQFDENGRKFSQRLENTLGKGEVAGYEQFLLFLQCFQKT